MLDQAPSTPSLIIDDGDLERLFAEDESEELDCLPVGYDETLIAVRRAFPGATLVST